MRVDRRYNAALGRAATTNEFETQDIAMKHSAIRLIGIGLVAFAGALWAQENTDPTASKAPEPESVVKEEAGQMIVERRVEGRLESVRVKPRVGPEYFIDDRVGDGSLVVPESGEMGSDHNIRTWKLGEW